jgi:YHS domain-containing protein
MFIRIFLIFLLGYLISYLYKKLWKGERTFINDKNGSDNNRSEPEEMKQDPVCKTYVPKSQAVIYLHRGEKLYFCSEACKRQYKQENK